MPPTIRLPHGVTRVLFDTNILIDAAVEPREHHDTANRLLASAERGAMGGLVAPASITTCWYVSTSTYGVAPPLRVFVDCT